MSIRIPKRERYSISSDSNSPSNDGSKDSLISLFAKVKINPQKKKKKDIEDLGKLFQDIAIKRTRDKDVDDLTALFGNTLLIPKKKQSTTRPLRKLIQDKDVDDLTALFGNTQLIPKKKQSTTRPRRNLIRDKDVDDLTTLFGNTIIMPKKKKKRNELIMLQDYHNLTNIPSKRIIKKVERYNDENENKRHKELKKMTKMRRTKIIRSKLKQSKNK